MTDLRDVKLSYQRRDEKFAAENAPIKGFLTQVEGSVKVTGQPGWVWCTDQNGGLIKAFNPRLPDRPNLPVLIKSNWRRDGQPAHPEVIDVDWEFMATDSTYQGQPFIREHASTHEWRGGFPGPDAMTLYPAAWAELQVTPASSGLVVHVSPLRYIYSGDLTEFAGLRNVDLSSYQPAAGLARWVLISLIRSTGALDFSQGNTGIDNPLAVLPRPALPAGAIPAAYVRLRASATDLTWQDIRSARSFLNGAGDDSGSEIYIDPSNFDNILSSADDTAQAAFDTLDDFISNWRSPQAGDVVYSNGSGWSSETPLIEGGRWLADGGVLLVVDSA